MPSAFYAFLALPKNRFTAKAPRNAKVSQRKGKAKRIISFANLGAFAVKKRFGKAKKDRKSLSLFYLSTL